jgi:predicted acylesterase/phospholipase RssA
MHLSPTCWCVQQLQETFYGGPQEIEDLWLPFFCVSTNLSNADVEVHQVGSLWKFVRASMSIVGMLPPVINHGEMLVDGGYLNNIPVDIMHSLGVGHVIVVRPSVQHPPSALAPEAVSSTPPSPVGRPSMMHDMNACGLHDVTFLPPKVAALLYQLQLPPARFCTSNRELQPSCIQWDVLFTFAGGRGRQAIWRVAQPDPIRWGTFRLACPLGAILQLAICSCRDPKQAQVS